MRAKNPQIGRRRSGPDAAEDETAHAEAQGVVSRRLVEVMDEDATEIATSPPGIPREDMVVRKAMPSDERITERPVEPRKPAPNARPRGRMEILGTEGAAGIAARARVEQIEAKLPEVTVPALKPLRTLLTVEEVSALERTLKGEFDQRDLRSAVGSPKRALERLIHDAAFNQLTIEHRALVLRAVARDPRDVEASRSAGRILERAVLATLKPAERDALLTSLAALRPRAQALLGDLAERPLHKGSALSDRDLQDAALVSHLARLASLTALAPKLEGAGAKRDETVGMLLASLAHPEQLPLEEGNESVLGILEFALADGSPAELTRLWTALSTDLGVELAGEGRLEIATRLKKNRYSPRESPVRQALESLPGLAHPRGGGKAGSFMMPGGHGIDADVTGRALSLLYGVGFTVAAGSTAALRQLDRLSEDPERVPPAFVSLLYDAGERLFVFDHASHDRLFFRAPHGASSKPKGARRLNPERQVEQPDRGLESVSMENFHAQVGVALVPRT